MEKVIKTDRNRWERGAKVKELRRPMAVHFVTFLLLIHTGKGIYDMEQVIVSRRGRLQ